MGLNECTCAKCQAKFTFGDKERDFYQRFSQNLPGSGLSVPPPTLCPRCRSQRRLICRNERKLYRRYCSQSGRPIISLYSEDKPYTVYAPDVWWSDAYDPADYGRKFDFTRPFFEQFAELDSVVPKLAIQHTKSENCDYTNYSAENRNCYMVVGTLGSEDCYYGQRVFYSRDCVDSYDLFRCELCYECSESSDLFGCSYVRLCQNSSDLLLCEECIGCQDCIGCINLRNKRYHIFNEQLTREEYLSKKTKLLADFLQLHLKYQTFCQTMPKRAARMINCENCSGDRLMGCKNCDFCFTLKNSEECRYVTYGENNRFYYDVDYGDNCEWQLNSCNLEKNYNVMCGDLAWYIHDSYYVARCFNSRYLFGCSGTKRQEHCILNAQFNPSEYNSVVPKLIKHMQDTGEWGYFFPPAHSPYCYNETVAYDRYPLSKEEALAQGFKWKDMDVKSFQSPSSPTYKRIEDVPEAIINEVLTCKGCGSNYRIVAQELAYYHRLDVALPELCSNCRHSARMVAFSADQMRTVKCARCAESIFGRDENGGRDLLCEKCFLEATS